MEEPSQAKRVGKGQQKQPSSLVTGVAGFIGSHLAERLLAEGHQVTGVDCFTDYYPRPFKEANLAHLRHERNFRFLEMDLAEADLEQTLKGADYVFHLAAQPGVRPSWGENFPTYVQHNIIATNRLLEAARESNIKRLVYASSSSIYGDAETYPTTEDTPPRPVSPYGVTKLVGEQLCYAYWKNFGVPVVALRYFTVYGPRQRPDMAFHRFIKAMLTNTEIEVYGDGEQTRDFTYVADAVHGNILAMGAPVTGQVFNIGGGSRISLNGAIAILEGQLKTRARFKRLPQPPGDVRHTGADISKAQRLLGFKPSTPLEDGLAQQIAWAQETMVGLR